MGHGAKKTEHSGAKKGKGAYLGRRVEAKKESNRKQRENDKESVTAFEYLNEVVVRLQALKDQAKCLGIFCNDRELLSCPHCGLKEDVTYEGRLVVCRDEAEDVDTGLRFPAPDENDVSRCPGCGRKAKVKSL